MKMWLGKVKKYRAWPVGLNRVRAGCWLAINVLMLLGCTPAAAQFSVLHHFVGWPADGAKPNGSLTVSGSTFYGMTYGGGRYDAGTIFKMNNDGSGNTLLHSFNGNDGACPNAALVLSGGTLYGMTTYGGNSDSGTIFKISTTGAGFTTLHHFNSALYDGSKPMGSLVLSGSTLFGVTAQGGSARWGTLFKINTDGSGFSVLHNFNPQTLDGLAPFGTLTLVGNQLYGTTLLGGLGPNIDGIIFRINTDGSGYIILHDFIGGTGEGRKPAGPLTYIDGMLYGMTLNGGSSDLGTVFRISTNGADFSTVYSFDAATANGGEPFGGLTLYGNTLYGMTSGGDTNFGMVFKLNTDGSGFSRLYNFTGGSSDGGYACGDLSLVGTKLYGLSALRGAYHWGTMFSLPRPPILLATANPANGGTVTGGGSYPAGTNLPLTATAKDGWSFLSWSDGLTNTTRTVTMPASDATYTANFGSPTGVGAAVGATNLTWILGGTAAWFGEGSVVHDAPLAAQSGAISTGQQTWFQTTTNGPLSLMFWWKVSSAPTNYLQFYINTQLVSQISGNVDWNQYVTFIGSTNPVTLKWVYTKNSATVSGSDAGFVDQVTVLPCPYATHVPQLFFQDNTGLIASWVLNSTGGVQFARVLANTGGWKLKAAGDIDGDGVSDLLFQNAASDTGGWFLNADGSVRDARFWFNIGGWEIKACADYEGTGRAQLFFQTARGDVAYWRLDTNGAFQSAVSLGSMGTWKLRGAGDLDGDHKAELFWQNTAGQVAIWYHGTNNTIRSALAFNTGEWTLSGVMDVDGDGVCDFIWQTPDSRTGGWFMQTNAVARDARFWWPTGGWKLKAAGR